MKSRALLALLLPALLSASVCAQSNQFNGRGRWHHTYTDSDSDTDADSDSRVVEPEPEDFWNDNSHFDEEFSGYLMTLFQGEGLPLGEQVYFAISVGNNPLRWRYLNGGLPVLSSTLGEQGVRDPFVIRNPHTGGFHLIGTDLKIYGNWDWNRAQRYGSRSINMWDSDDLVNWSEQRLVTVSSEQVGNTWAPEALWDDELGAFVVYWASKIYDVDDPNHLGAQYHRMLTAITPDFKSFGAPRVWIDAGYSVIDTAVLFNNGTYYRFSKDESPQTADYPCGKHVFAEKSTTLISKEWEKVAECLGSDDISAGEGPIAFRSTTDESQFYLFIDEFGGRGYIPFETSDLDSMEWTVPEGEFELPPNRRHGSIIPITGAEYERLLVNYSPELIVTDIAPISVSFAVNETISLPDTIISRLGDGSTAEIDVVWEAPPVTMSQSPGKFYVKGSVTVDTTRGLFPLAAVTIEEPVHSEL